MSHTQHPLRAVHVVRAIALATGLATLADCSEAPSTIDSGMTGGGAVCSCADASMPATGACTTEQLDAGCQTLLGAGPLLPPDLVV